MANSIIHDLSYTDELIEAEMGKIIGGYTGLSSLARGGVSLLASIYSKSSDLISGVANGTGTVVGSEVRSVTSNSSSSAGSTGSGGGYSKTSPAIFESKDGDRIY